MACMRNCLSAAKCLKMATPIFLGNGNCTMMVYSEMLELLSVKDTKIYSKESFIAFSHFTLPIGLV